MKLTFKNDWRAAPSYSWYTRYDSNVRHLVPKTSALSAELRVQNFIILADFGKLCHQNGTSHRNRTCNLRHRKPTLYPVELTRQTMRKALLFYFTLFNNSIRERRERDNEITDEQKKALTHYCSQTATMTHRAKTPSSHSYVVFVTSFSHPKSRCISTLIAQNHEPQCTKQQRCCRHNNTPLNNTTRQRSNLPDA